MARDTDLEGQLFVDGEQGAQRDWRRRLSLLLLSFLGGGVLEYVALITGYRALLALVFAFYLLAFVTRPKRGKDTTPPSSAARRAGSVL